MQGAGVDVGDPGDLGVVGLALVVAALAVDGAVGHDGAAVAVPGGAGGHESERYQQASKPRQCGPPVSPNSLWGLEDLRWSPGEGAA